jgi:hypothetical protein
MPDTYCIASTVVLLIDRFSFFYSQVWVEAMEKQHGDVPQLQRHFWAAAYQIALFRDALALARFAIICRGAIRSGAFHPGYNFQLQLCNLELEECQKDWS